MKKVMNRSGLAGLLAAVLAGGMPALAPAATLDLTGIGFVQYGDAQSYSLPIANLQVGAPNSPGSPYYVNSTPGAIKDLIVVATGASGGPVNTNFAGMDNAYPTPSGVSGSTFFSTGTVADPAPTFTGDRTVTWDAQLTSLQTFLSGESMVIFFNNNQINSGGASFQSLAAWAQITVTNAAGTIIGQFDFINRSTFAEGPQPYNLVSQGGGGTFLGDVTTYTSPAGYNAPVSGDNSATDYVLSGGQICVNTSLGPIPVPVPCGSPGASAPINHNLGANQAVYAIIFPELDALLAALFASGADLTGFTLHADIRLGCEPGTPAEVCESLLFGRNLNNGYEQIFIGTTTRVTIVPEPDTIALLGLGLLGILGIGAATRRRKI